MGPAIMWAHHTIVVLEWGEDWSIKGILEDQHTIFQGFVNGYSQQEVVTLLHGQPAPSRTGNRPAHGTLIHTPPWAIAIPHTRGLGQRHWARPITTLHTLPRAIAIPHTGVLRCNRRLRGSMVGINHSVDRYQIDTTAGGGRGGLTAPHSPSWTVPIRVGGLRCNRRWGDPAPISAPLGVPSR